MSEHTAEPWYMRTNRHTDTDGRDWGWVDALPPGGSQRPIAGVQITWTRGELSETNARRIVACVNACKDVDNETLEKIASGDMDGSEIVELAKVKKQHDALLALIRECRGTLRTDQHDGHRRLARKIDATIAESIA